MLGHHRHLLTTFTAAPRLFQPLLCASWGRDWTVDHMAWLLPFTKNRNYIFIYNNHYALALHFHYNNKTPMLYKRVRRWSSFHPISVLSSHILGQHSPLLTTLHGQLFGQFFPDIYISSNTRRSTNVDLMLVHRLRSWPSIKRLLLAGYGTLVHHKTTKVIEPRLAQTALIWCKS